jgi:hypothetical protein
VKKKIPLAIAFILALLPIAATIFHSVRLVGLKNNRHLEPTERLELLPAILPIDIP